MNIRMIENDMMIVSNKPTLHTPIQFIEKAFNSLIRTNPINYKNDGEKNQQTY